MDRCAPVVCRSPSAFRHASRARVVAVAFVLIAANAAFAAESTVQHRFDLHGTGVLKPAVSAQRNGSLQLKATLSPAGAGNAAPAMQSGGGFQMTAILITSSLVCYNDTIFRDDFDGDGF